MKNTIKGLVTSAVLAASGLGVFSQQALANKDNFHVANHSDYDIVQLYMSASHIGIWIPISGVNRLPSESSIQVIFPDSSSNICWYDIKAVFSTGEVYEDYRINVCSNLTYLEYFFYDTQPVYSPFY